MQRLVRAWWRFWFAPAGPQDLGIGRLLFFSGLLLMYGQTDFTAWSDVSRAYWMPLPLFELLHLRPLSREGLAAIEVVWKLSLLAAALGWHTTISTSVAFALAFYLLGLPHNFGHTFHFDAMLVIAMGILACARCGDAWSIDSALSGRSRGRSGDYRWPVRAIWVAMALVFFAAGVAKVRHGGLEWIFSSNLSIVLNRAAYHVSDADPITTLGLFVSRHEALSRIIAAATVIVELGFAVALFSRRARVVLVPAAFLMLVGIRVMMGPTFGGFLVANVFWVPWSAVLAIVTNRVRSPRQSAATLAGDVCTASQAVNPSGSSDIRKAAI